MTLITKALIVDKPWIDLILSGRKTWEMRSSGTSFRGWFGLIQKGSGQVVGIARMTGSGVSLSPEQLVASIDRHHIPERMIRSGKVARWTIPWHLADARPLAVPVHYIHPAGAVTWVNLDDAVTRAIGSQVNPFTPEAPSPNDVRSAMDISQVRRAVEPVPITPRKSSSRLIGTALLTEGNLKNSHFYLREFLHHLPEDLVGGRDLAQPVLADVEAEGTGQIRTDICPRHRFFRSRSFTREFFANTDAAPGDTVTVYELAPYRYRIAVTKNVSLP